MIHLEDLENLFALFNFSVIYCGMLHILSFVSKLRKKRMRIKAIFLCPYLQTLQKKAGSVGNVTLSRVHLTIFAFEKSEY
jgi:hypothetical protein